jgi:hypothetical protein
MTDVNLWTNNKSYVRDKILSNEENTMVGLFPGQRSGARDDLIFTAKHMIGGRKGKRQLLGVIQGVVEIDKKETRMFIVVVKMMKNQPFFATKNALCEYYGWEKCDNHLSGITKH